MKKYRIKQWGSSIEEVEIIKTTQSSVYFLHNGYERRELDTYYFDSKELAGEAILQRENDKVKRCESLLKSAIDERNEIINELFG